MVTQEKLEVKLKQLHIAVERTKSVIVSSSREAIERQLSTLKSTCKNVNQIRVVVEEIKIQSNEDMATITTWNSKLDSKLTEADNAMKVLRNWVDECENRK